MSIDQIKCIVFPWLAQHGCKSILSGVICGTYEVRDLTTNEKLIFHEDHLETVPAGYTGSLEPEYDSDILSELYDAVDDMEIY